LTFDFVAHFYYDYVKKCRTNKEGTGEGVSARAAVFRLITKPSTVENFVQELTLFHCTIDTFSSKTLIKYFRKEIHVFGIGVVTNG